MLDLIDTSLYKEKPRELCIESTTSCNCRCDFCYNQNSFAKNGRDDNGLSTAELKKIIDIVSDAGIERIRFTGGEPLLRKDIFELASYAKEKNLQTVLNTNGMLIDKQKGEKISELIMLTDDEEDYVVMRLTGDFTIQDIRQIADEVEK